MEKNRPYDYPKPGISEDLYEAPVDTRPHSRDPKPANEIARLLDHRLAMQRDSAAPDAALMKAKASMLLTALRYSQKTAADDLPELEAAAVNLARSQIAQIGDATVRAGKYHHPVYFLAWETHWEADCYDT